MKPSRGMRAGPTEEVICLWSCFHCRENRSLWIGVPKAGEEVLEGRNRISHIFTSPPPPGLELSSSELGQEETLDSRAT